MVQAATDLWFRVGFCGVRCMLHSRAAAQGTPVLPAKFVQQLCLNLRAPPRPPKDFLSTVREPFGRRPGPHTFLRPKKRAKDPKRPAPGTAAPAAPSAAQAQAHALPDSRVGLNPATEAALDASEEANPTVSATARKLPGVVADAEEAAGAAAAQAAEVKKETKKVAQFQGAAAQQPGLVDAHRGRWVPQG